MEPGTSLVQQIHRMMTSLFDLTENEARVFLAILSNPNTSPSELAGLTELPRTRIYSYTQRLLTRGLIEEVEDVHKVFRSLPVESIVKQKERELFEEYGEKRSQLRELSKKLQCLWEQPEPSRAPELYQSFTFEQLMAMISAAREELVITSIPGGGRFPWTEGAYALVRALRRGVRLHYISSSEEVNATFMRYMGRLLSGPELENIVTTLTDYLPCNVIRVDHELFIVTFSAGTPRILRLVGAELRRTYEFILEGVCGRG